MHFSLCDLVADIAQNAAESGASEVLTTLEEREDFFCFVMEDNGQGMTEQELKRVSDPFYTDGIKHPGRSLGLGIPFLIQTAEGSGGTWSIESKKGKGTTVRGSFNLRAIDTPPLGDVPVLIRTFFMFSGPEEWRLRWLWSANGEENEVELRKTELAEILGGFESAEALNLLDKFLRSQQET